MKKLVVLALVAISLVAMTSVASAERGNCGGIGCDIGTTSTMLSPAKK